MVNGGQISTAFATKYSGKMGRRFEIAEKFFTFQPLECF
jgi:hypothetical protein